MLAVWIIYHQGKLKSLQLVIVMKKTSAGTSKMINLFKTNKQHRYGAIY